MAVVQGNAALASDYNTLRGEVNRWFADNYAGSISFGNGNQSYGWGGSAVSSVSAGVTNMLASQMNSLVDRCNLGEGICSNVFGTLPQVVSGTGLPTALEFNNIESKSDSITTDRLNMQANKMSLTTGGSSVRSTTWSSAINCTFRYTFASFDKARYFFNSGGALTILGSITGYSTGAGWDGEGFDGIFSGMGSIFMNHTETTQSGAGGTPTSIGYYDLTTSYETIFTQLGSGSYAYTDVGMLIEARYGSSGAYVELRVTLTPGLGRSVNGTTTITTQRRKLATQYSGGASLTITAPTYSLIDAL